MVTIKFGEIGRTRFGFELAGTGFVCIHLGLREWFWMRGHGFEYSRNEHLA